MSKRDLNAVIKERDIALKQCELMRKDLAAALELLRDIEWCMFYVSSTREGHGCPACRKWKREGHTEDCWIGKRIDALTKDAEVETK